MDIQMPEMNGVDATRTIRQREVETGRARTPIIAVTANAMTHQVAEYDAAGMDEVVAKPVDNSLPARGDGSGRWPRTRLRRTARAYAAWLRASPGRGPIA